MDFQTILHSILTVVIVVAQIATVYLAARGNRWTWILGIVTGLILCYNFLSDRLYMSLAFQVYSIAASIGGVFIWKKKEEDNKRTICWGNPFWPLLVVVGLTAAVYYFDAQVLKSNLPVLDCAITSLQAVATFLMVRKDINAWICYLICDAIYIPLGIIGGNYQWLFISGIFLITSTFGFITFIKAYLKIKQEKAQANRTENS